ncbi:MAG TPA: hypothetical protein VI299_09505, partial [Polyangiales bacterium]
MKVSHPLGLVFSFSEGGALASIDTDAVRISMTSASEFSRAGANLFLRKRGPAGVCTALLGAHSPSHYGVTGGQFCARGRWAGLDYACVLQLAPSQLAWRWRVEITNTLDHAIELDLIHVQDVGLKTKSSGLVNESYVSQYLERRVFEHGQYGSVVCCRQNMKEAGGNPWLMLASVNGALAASTDGLQFYGRTFRATGEPEALGEGRLAGELSGEASVVALQERPFVLQPGAVHVSAFVASYQPDHPEASSEADLQRLPTLVAAFADPVEIEVKARVPQAELLRAPLLQAEDLTPAELEDLFGSDRRHAERADGQLLSFFSDGPRHVVLRAKELQVDRPHGHIMQANVGYAPDERIMSTTAFACGVFHSHLTQGNTNFNTLLSVCTQPSAASLEGQRIIVQSERGAYLLGVPSA